MRHIFNFHEIQFIYVSSYVAYPFGIMSKKLLLVQGHEDLYPCVLPSVLHFQLLYFDASLS